MSLVANLSVFVGEDRAIVATILSEAGGPQNIVDWTLSWMVKRRTADDDEDAVIVKTTADSPGGIDLTDPEAGICTITLSDADTDELMPRPYVHELKRMDAGFEAVLFYGNFILNRAVHHA